MKKSKKPGGRTPHLWTKVQRWGFIFCKTKDREPPSLTRWVFIFGQIVSIFVLANLYLMAKAQTPQNTLKTKILNSSMIITEVQARNFPFLIQWPIEGEISQSFSKKHPGLDIQAPYGTDIHPFGQGIVTETGYKLGYGKIIIIKHEEGFSSLYAHLSQIQVEPNQIVNLDTKIGKVGTSGWTTGAHLHLEIYENGKTVDPKNLLP